MMHLFEYNLFQQNLNKTRKKMKKRSAQTLIGAIETGSNDKVAYLVLCSDAEIVDLFIIRLSSTKLFLYSWILLYNGLGY